MNSPLHPSPVRVILGPGSLQQLADCARAEGIGRPMLFTDAGVVAAGHAVRVTRALSLAGSFDQIHENPTTVDVDFAVGVAKAAGADGFIALGGGSVIDCAKAANLLLTNGGKLADYVGEGKAARPLLPLIAVPTTAGTGSEAQSFALISHGDTHMKMVIGDRRLPTDGGMRPRVTILDPELTATLPRRVAALAGIDAISHAVESAVTTARNEESIRYSQAAWAKLQPAFTRAVSSDPDPETRISMLMGAHLAGLAIEHSMLGAAHACANPLTARFQIAHGQAVGLMLPHVVRFNSEGDSDPYVVLGACGSRMAILLEELLNRGGLATRLRELGVPQGALDVMADDAAAQWTAQFNPRPVSRALLRGFYSQAW